MNAAHLHIVLNHIPVIGVPFGAVLLIFGLVRRSEEVKRAALLAFVLIALITVPTFLSGKAAEDIVEHLPGVVDDLIEHHEDAALIALISTSVLGALSLMGLGWSLVTGKLGLPATVLLILISLGVSGWLGRTANLGGKIRHTEFRDGTAGVEDHDEEEDGEKGRGRNRRGRRGGRDR